jgi:hypothetical protein
LTRTTASTTETINSLYGSKSACFIALHPLILTKAGDENLISFDNYYNRPQKFEILEHCQPLRYSLITRVHVLLNLEDNNHALYDLSLMMDSFFIASNLFDTILHHAALTCVMSRATTSSFNLFLKNNDGTCNSIW